MAMALPTEQPGSYSHSAILGWAVLGTGLPNMMITPTGKSWISAPEIPMDPVQLGEPHSLLPWCQP